MQRPGEEVMVVGPGDDLLAVGQLLLTPVEMGSFKYGVAVKIREGLESQKGESEK